MSTKVTMTDTAYNCMIKRKKEIEFSKLWQEVAKAMKIPEEKLSRKKRQFYAELMDDRRFASLSGNKWDLRSRRSYSEVSADAIVLDEDDEGYEAEERELLDLPKGGDLYCSRGFCPFFFCPGRCFGFARRPRHLFSRTKLYLFSTNPKQDKIIKPINAD